MNDVRLLTAKRHYDTALALHRQDKLAEAEQHYLAVCRIFPNHPGALHGAGLIALRKGAHEDAAQYLAKASKLAPDNPAIRCDLGQAYLAVGRYGDALHCFETVLAGHPDDTAALMGAGDALNVLGRPKEAQLVFDKLLARDSNNAVAQFGRGAAFMQMNRPAEARAAYEKAVALDPTRATYHRALAEAAPFEENDPRLAALEALESNGLTGDQAVELHFSLAKAYDDLGRYEAAFAHLQKGNAVKHQLVSYDEHETANIFRAVTAAFTPASFERNFGHLSTLPIFIVGMPRSGTSLAEQILTADPSVYGAGETTIVQESIAAGLAGRDYPNSIGRLPGHALRRFGQEYAKKLEARAPGSAYIIDKLPGNFLHLGLIHLALPNAKIVHMRREPMDSGFSCYSKLFLNGLNYTYDLGELGRYYRMYDALMAHWRAVLPEGVMLDVDYEALVGDFENQTRRMVAHCGLEWSDRFLAFHENERAVRTHSQLQVRQPIFASSIGRWRHYEPWLSPLKDALAQPG